jgi:nucleotide-binding universal stress UspA family protein
MPTLLLPCDGSSQALAAVRHVIAEVRAGAAHRIHLVNVQAPFATYIARHVDPEARMDFHRERAEEALASAKALLDAAGVAYQAHMEVGSKAPCIARLAQRLACDRIVLSTVRRSGLMRFIGNSLTTGLLEHCTAPVEVIVAERCATPARIAPVLQRASAMRSVGRRP